MGPEESELSGPGHSLLSRSLAGQVREFSWQNPRSTPSLIRAVVEKARSDGLPLLSFGNCS